MESSGLDQCSLPPISTHHNRIMMDIDPEQQIEESYKMKNKQVVCWRFLRQISFVDLVNFHGRPEMQKQFNKFEGNIEEQALILQNRFKRKNVELSQGMENGCVRQGECATNGGTHASMMPSDDGPSQMQQ